MARYIFVTGGVLSSLGKGIASASLAALLQAHGYKVRVRKLDPYINVDPGTMSPYQHGEVFVTDDGAETDLDLGHYERFTNVNAEKTDNITAGRVYLNVIEKERQGDYLGKTVQVIPHITDEIKRFVRHGAEVYDFVICELGGTVGDIEGLPFIEAFRQIRTDVGVENTFFLHLVLVPFIQTAQEVKTKPAQHSVKDLLSLGIQPNALLCRCATNIPMDAKEKIALFCNTRLENVFEAVDVDTIYKVPTNLHLQGLDSAVCKYFSLSGRGDLRQWEDVEQRFDKIKSGENITIGIVGKYTELPDAYKSILEALVHAGLHQDVRVKIEWVSTDDLAPEDVVKVLAELDGVIMPGGFGKRGGEGKILAAKYARQNTLPCLGICYGMQMMLIEYARNVAGIENATTTEWDEDGEPLVHAMTTWQDDHGVMHRVNDDDGMGGTMRLGGYDCVLQVGSKAQGLYEDDVIRERHRHRYEGNAAYKKQLDEAGLIFSGMSPDGQLPEIIEVADHPFYIGVQFHPEFKSRPFAPHPLFSGLVQSALEHKKVKNNASH